MGDFYFSEIAFTSFEQLSLDLGPFWLVFLYQKRLFNSLYQYLHQNLMCSFLYHFLRNLGFWMLWKEREFECITSQFGSWIVIFAENENPQLKLALQGEPVRVSSKIMCAKLLHYFRSDHRGKSQLNCPRKTDYSHLYSSGEYSLQYFF